MEATIVAKKFKGDHEPRWHAGLGVLGAIALYITLPPKLTFGPVWIFALAMLGLLVPLVVLSPTRKHETPLQRGVSVALIAILNLFNLLSVVFLINAILTPGEHLTGRQLFLAGMQIWLTNILVFALWYWEVDAGGPEHRAHAESAHKFIKSDFLFPQLSTLEPLQCFPGHWKPLFVDYLYLAFTNASAFSPADTFPLTRRAKMLMLFEALISFVTIGVVVSRAVGILT